MIYGVRCTTVSGEDVLVKVEAKSADAALAEVWDHVAVFYGPGDAAGRRNPDTLAAVHEVVE